MKKNKWLYLIDISLVVLLIFICYFIYQKFNPYYRMENRVNRIEKFQKEKEEQVLGWIKVQGTNIDYPVINNNNLISINDIDYDYTWMNHEATSLENRTAIFGHNILNVSTHPLIGDKEHSRFEQLMGFLYPEFSEKNKYIQYTVGKEDYLFKIYSVAFVKETDMGLNLKKKDKKSYIEKAQKRSYFDFDVDVNEDDPLITLITCTRFFGPTTEYEFKIEGRLVRKGELIKNYKLKETDNYKEIKKIMKEDDINEQKA